MLESLNTPGMRLAALVIVLCNLGFALYIFQDDVLPRKQRLPFVLAALITGPFLFGRLYFKKVDQQRKRELRRLHERYAKRRRDKSND